MKKDQKKQENEDQAKPSAVKVKNSPGGQRAMFSAKGSRRWYLIDAKNKVLGRLGTKIAKILMGKDKVDFARYDDRGDAVVVINAAKVAVTGRKEQNKTYYRYTGYPSGLKETSLEKLREKKPEALIYHAVAGMLPKNRLGKGLIKKLYIYPEEKHPHEAQKLIELEAD